MGDIRIIPSVSIVIAYKATPRHRAKHISAIIRRLTRFVPLVLRKQGIPFGGANFHAPHQIVGKRGHGGEFPFKRVDS
jgi:hypothetical protein